MGIAKEMIQALVDGIRSKNRMQPILNFDVNDLILSELLEKTGFNFWYPTFSEINPQNLKKYQQQNSTVKWLKSRWSVSVHHYPHH